MFMLCVNSSYTASVANYRLGDDNILGYWKLKNWIEYATCPKCIHLILHPNKNTSKFNNLKAKGIMSLSVPS